jgi:pimeloyl-ACP methyl ester carboxylesterase
VNKKKGIFMIHGMWATASFWDNYRDYFQSEGYDTRAVTLLYHAKPPYPGGLQHVSLTDYVDQCAREIQKMDDKPVVIGHSMGGIIAQKMAEMGLADRLVLLAPAIAQGKFVLPRSVFHMFSHNMLDILLKRPFRISFKKATERVLNALPPDEQEREYSEFVYESGKAAIGVIMGEIGVDAANVDCPVLVIVGLADRARSPQVSKKVADKYSARYLEYPGFCHHMVSQQGWERIAADIVTWIRSDEPI